MRPIGKISARGGMTLAEVIVSLAILAIIAMTISLVVSGSSKMMNSSSDVKNEGQEAFANLQSELLSDEKLIITPDKSVRIEGESLNEPIVIKGRYKTVKSEKNGTSVTFSVFEPDI